MVLTSALVVLFCAVASTVSAPVGGGADPTNDADDVREYGATRTPSWGLGSADAVVSGKDDWLRPKATEAPIDRSERGTSSWYSLWKGSGRSTETESFEEGGWRDYFGRKMDRGASRLSPDQRSEGESSPATPHKPQSQQRDPYEQMMGLAYTGL